MSKNSYNYSGVDSNAVKKIIIALIILALVAYKVKVCFRENPAEVIKG